jgi:hypothetical protein
MSWVLSVGVGPSALRLHTHSVTITPTPPATAAATTATPPTPARTIERERQWTRGGLILERWERLSFQTTYPSCGDATGRAASSYRQSPRGIWRSVEERPDCATWYPQTHI